MVAGPHKSTQAKMLSKVKAQNDNKRIKHLQRDLVQWVLNNPDKVSAMNDMIHNGQLDMYIHGQEADQKGQAPLLRRCNTWGKKGISDQKKVLFNGKHLASSSAKKLCKTSEDKDRMWIFITARKKSQPIAPNMTHQELWDLMDNRIVAVGDGAGSLVVVQDKVNYLQCGPWDTTQRSEEGLIIIQHRYIPSLKAHAFIHHLETSYFCITF